MLCALAHMYKRAKNSVDLQRYCVCFVNVFVEIRCFKRDRGLETNLITEWYGIMRVRVVRYTGLGKCSRTARSQSKF